MFPSEYMIYLRERFFCGELCTQYINYLVLKSSDPVGARARADSVIQLSPSFFLIRGKEVRDGLKNVLDEVQRES